MSISRKLLVLGVIVGALSAGLVFSTQSGATLTTTRASHPVQTVGSTNVNPEWDEYQTEIAVETQAAIDALNAQQAQALADQLSAAQTRLEAAPRAPVAAVAVSPQPAPCPAPNVPLGWIAWCESGCNPTAHNNSSTAAGKYQWLTSSWGGYGGYPTADAAPEYVQDQKSLEAFQASGTSPWAASQGCWEPHV